MRFREAWMGILFVLIVLIALHGLFLWFVEISFKEVKGRKEIAQALYLSSHVALRDPQPLAEERDPFRWPARFSIEEMNALDRGRVDPLHACYYIKEKEGCSPMWWHALPICEPLNSVEDKEMSTVIPTVFWRGEMTPYVKKATPISIDWRELTRDLTHACSACTLRYHIQVDLAHGRLLCLEPIEEGEEEASISACVRARLWQHRFHCAPEGGIVSGEVELCFNGEYAAATETCMRLCEVK